jgi:hypothetical protein
VYEIRIRQFTFKGSPGTLKSPAGVLNRYVIMAVSAALKTVMVARPSGLLEVESVSFPFTVPWEKHRETKNEEMKNKIILFMAFVKVLKYTI